MPVRDRRTKAPFAGCDAPFVIYRRSAAIRSMNGENVPNAARERVEDALRILSMEAWHEDGTPVEHTYTLAEDLYRIHAAIPGGPFASLGDAIKDACVELRLALQEMDK